MPDQQEAIKLCHVASKPEECCMIAGKTHKNWVAYGMDIQPLVEKWAVGWEGNVMLLYWRRPQITYG